MVLDGSSGFVYYVSITGITGTRSASTDSLAAAIPRVRRATDLPIAIGFGVRTPEQAADAVRVADAAVVASALIETLAASLDAQGRAGPDTVRRVLDQVRALADGVRGARVAPRPHELADRVRPAQDPHPARPARGAGKPVDPVPVLPADDLPSRAGANLKVCPHCGHHMRGTRPSGCLDLRRRPVHPHRAAQGAARPAAVPRQQALLRPPEGGAREDRARRRAAGGARHHRRPPGRGGGDGVRVHGRLHGRRRWARASWPRRGWPCCRTRR